MDASQFVLNTSTATAIFSGFAAALFLQSINKAIIKGFWEDLSGYSLFGAFFFGFLAVTIQPTRWSTDPVILWLLSIIYFYVVAIVALHIGFLFRRWRSIPRAHSWIISR